MRMFNEEGVWNNEAIRDPDYVAFREAAKRLFERCENGLDERLMIHALESEVSMIGVANFIGKRRRARAANQPQES